MRKRFLIMAFMAACAAVTALSQPHPHSGIEDLLRPHAHATPAQANAPHTPEVLFDATNLGSPMKLDRGWRVGITSNQDAAQPEFDDSTWAVRDARESFEDVPDEDHHPGASPQDPNAPHPPGHKRPYVWFRLHLKLAANHAPLFLLLELPPSLSGSSGPETLGLDVYSNGHRIQPEGPHADIPERYQQISRIYPLNIDPPETEVTLAIKTELIPVGSGAYTNFFSRRTIHLGNRQDLDRVLELWSFHNLFERLPHLVNSILLTVLALFLLALYFTQKGHIEYLWLALYELLQAPIGLLDLAGSTARVDHVLFTTAVFQLLVISAYLYFEFLVAFLASPKKWYIRMLRFSAPVPILACISPVILLPAHGSGSIILLAIIFVISVLWVLSWLIFIFTTLIQATLRRNFEAGLLLVPLLLSLVGWIENILIVSMNDLAGRPYRSPLTLQAGPVPIHFASFADFAGILVIVLIIFVRFLRIHRDQERASSELAAARSVQELMIPQEKLHTPGFEVESIYSPANEVGGDFYHVQAMPDGSLLVVIGDVAGKGLKAAMNVSMLMGALRGIPERSPAKILAALNRVLRGSESFTTCQAALFLPSGEVILANAGHLPPYLNSQEVAVAGGLPLGVIADVEYDEIRLYLHQGDRILLMSDGVVEARRPTGELFGFDRVHNLSNLSAFYIADAAKSFGQEDDITVLTVRRQ